MVLRIVQVTDNGKEFHIVSNGIRGVVPRELLDDQNLESTEDREAWIHSNSSSIESALESKKSGGFVRSPFDRVVLREAQ